MEHVEDRNVESLLEVTELLRYIIICSGFIWFHYVFLSLVLIFYNIGSA